MNRVRSALAALSRKTPKFPGKVRIIRLVDRLLPGRRLPTIATVDGVTYSLSSADIISRAVLYEGVYQSDVLEACDRIMGRREEGVLWDVGANIGAMSLPLLKRHKTWRSICFEPAPSVTSSLARNRSLNPQLADRLTIICAPLLDRGGLTEFYPSCEAHNWGVGRPEKSHNTVARPIYIGGYSGYQLLTESGLPKPNLIKIDVEGFEYEVLKGLQQLLEQSEQISLLFELSQYRYADRHVSETDVLGLVQSCGFRLYKVDAGGTIRPMGEGDSYGDIVATKHELFEN